MIFRLRLSQAFSNYDERIHYIAYVNKRDVSKYHCVIEDAAILLTHLLSFENNGFQTLEEASYHRIQFTIEYENKNKSLDFLDTKITNDKSGRYDLTVYRKDAITNVQINTCVIPSVIINISKVFLTRAKRICSEKHLEEEINFLIEMFVENGHDGK